MSTGSAARSVGTVYELNVAVVGIRPRIWRRLQVPSTMDLGRLHRALQVCFGWDDDHLHQFTVGETKRGAALRRYDRDIDEKDETRTRLSKTAPNEQSSLIYTYDFGDNWEVEIVVQKILPRDPGGTYPVCLAGRRAGPVEDCGGIFGYEKMCEALADPTHEDHEEYVEWFGNEFDPEAFDIDAVNARLGKL